MNFNAWKGSHERPNSTSMQVASLRSPLQGLYLYSTSQGERRRTSNHHAPGGFKIYKRRGIIDLFRVPLAFQEVLCCLKFIIFKVIRLLFIIPAYRPRKTEQVFDWSMWAHVRYLDRLTDGSFSHSCWINRPKSLINYAHNFFALARTSSKFCSVPKERLGNLKCNHRWCMHGWQPNSTKPDVLQMAQLSESLLL